MNRSIGKLQTRSLSETIVDELVQLIASGGLKPGQRLNEVRLADGFGVSRGPLREAARELEGQGLVVSRPRQGFYVAEFSARDIADLYEVKRWIDEAVIEDVLTYSDVATRQEILADVNSIDDSEKMAFSNSLFAYRSRMVERLHNRFLASQALFLYRQFHIVTALVNPSDPAARIERIIGTLRRFWQALVEGDGKAAAQIMAEDREFWLADLVPRFAANDTTAERQRRE